MSQMPFTFFDFHKSILYGIFQPWPWIGDGYTYLPDRILPLSETRRTGMTVQLV